MSTQSSPLASTQAMAQVCLDQHLQARAEHTPPYLRTTHTYHTIQKKRSNLTVLPYSVFLPTSPSLEERAAPWPLRSPPPKPSSLVTEGLSHQHHLPVWVYSVEEATASLADGDLCDCLLKYCHSCMHKLISCDGAVSAEIDGDKFGITMLGTMSSVCVALHIF